MQDFPHYKYSPRRKKKNEQKSKTEIESSNNNCQAPGTSFPLVAQKNSVNSQGGRQGQKSGLDLNQISPKIETVETPESSPNELALVQAAHQAARDAQAAGSNPDYGYFDNPFQHSALPTPEISPQDEIPQPSVPSNHPGAPTGLAYTLENNPLIHHHYDQDQQQHPEVFPRRFYHHHQGKRSNALLLILIHIYLPPLIFKIQSERL